MVDPTSPGRNIASRASTERTLERAIEPGVASYITTVRDHTLGLVATAEMPHPAFYEDMWEQAVADITGPMYSTFTRTEVEAMIRVLKDASIAEYAYDTAAELLTTARVQSWTRNDTRAAINDFLDPYKGGPAVAAVARSRHQLPSAVIEEGGQKWMTRAMREVRSLATEIVSDRTMSQIRYAGLPFKQWVSRHDPLTRPSHVAADGQVVPVDSKFLVGAARMEAPGDPTAPGEEYFNCRCIVIGLIDENPY